MTMSVDRLLEWIGLTLMYGCQEACEIDSMCFSDVVNPSSPAILNRHDVLVSSRTLITRQEPHYRELVENT